MGRPIEPKVAFLFDVPTFGPMGRRGLGFEMVARVATDMALAWLAPDKRAQDSTQGEA